MTYAIIVKTKTMKTFTISIKPFLTINPDYEVDADVTHMDGIIYKIELSPYALRFLKASNEFYTHIEAAALNNHQSTLNEQPCNDVV